MNPPFVEFETKEMTFPVSSVQDQISLLDLIKSCGKEKNILKTKQIHSGILKRNYDLQNVRVMTALLRTYAKCGSLRETQQIFEQLPVHDVVSWTALIAGYVDNGLGDEALRCYKQMRDEGFWPDAVTYVCVLKACGIVRSIEVGEDINAEVTERGLLQKDVELGGALVDMYAKCGALEKAQLVFQALPAHNVVSWTALIAGYTQHGFGSKALKCFAKMKDEGIYPNTVTYICALKACAIERSLDIGEGIAFEVEKKGLLQKDVALGNILVDMYAKCGALNKACHVLKRLSEQDVVPWTALIAGYEQHGKSSEALDLFKQMQDTGVHPDAITYVWVLKACGSIGCLETGEEIYLEVRKKGLLQKNIVIGSTVVDMYAKCGSLGKAREVFNEIPVQNVVSWNSMITGYAQMGLADEALRFFWQMKDKGVCPDLVTYICILKVCGVLGCLGNGEGIDIDVRQRGLLQNDVVLGTTLVDMYAKCGAFKKAREVFEELPMQNIVSWNALMAGYAQLGEAVIVLDLLRKMRAKGIVPDAVTFVAVLTACSHAGFLNEGEKLFNDMCALYHHTPVLEHYTCMIDLFGRAGNFVKMTTVFDRSLSSSYLPIFLTILNASCKWLNMKIGKWAFEQLLQIDEKCAAAYLCMEKIYLQLDMQREG